VWLSLVHINEETPMTLRRYALAAAATAAVTATVLALPLSAASADERGSSSGGYTIGLWGDQPYNTAGITAEPGVLADINKQELVFTVFDGDIKAGNGSFCGTDPVTGYNPYTNAQSMFASIKWATIYTPGDNEWTDCDRIGNGALNPNVQLALIRQMFFSDNKSQGQDRLDVTQQSPSYPENARWEHDGVTYITVHTPGTDNNAPQFAADGVTMLTPDKKPTSDPTKQNGDLAEYTARNAANLTWLQSGFDFAKKRGSKGIMIVQQADMWNTELNGTVINPDPVVHYAEEKAKLAQLVAGFPGKVALINGDTHQYLIDNPLNLRNFTRVITPGDTQHGWVRVDVNATSANVFSFAPQLLP
jgi:hypothetical protein